MQNIGSTCFELNNGSLWETLQSTNGLSYLGKITDNLKGNPIDDSLNKYKLVKYFDNK
jgi:hypothetical protein